MMQWGACIGEEDDFINIVILLKQKKKSIHLFLYQASNWLFKLTTNLQNISDLLINFKPKESLKY